MNSIRYIFLHLLHLSVKSTLFLKRTKTVFVSYFSLYISYLSTHAFKKCTGSLNDEHKGGFNLESLDKNVTIYLFSTQIFKIMSLYTIIN